MKDILNSTQIELISEYHELYEDNHFVHLSTTKLDKINQGLRKRIYKEFVDIDNFRNIYDQYIKELTILPDIDYIPKEDLVEEDVTDKYVTDLKKQLFKKDNYIKDLKKEKQLLLNQVCNQENYYDYMRDNFPDITYNMVNTDKTVKRDVKEGTAILHLSDLHYGEVVEMGNTIYDCAIAEARLKSIMDQFCEIVKDYNKATIFVNGDMVNGCIHDEFNKTNEMTIIDTVLRLSKLLSEHFINVWEHFKGQLDIIFTVGNHARTIPGDVYYKNKVKENWEYLLGNMVKHELEGISSKLYVEVSNTPAIVVPIEDLKIAVTHGDCFKSLNNIRVGVAKFQEMNIATIGPFDHLLIGHFHATHIENGLGGKIFANGCFKECDEYSTAHLFSICQPEQTCLILEKGKIKNIIILNAND